MAFRGDIEFKDVVFRYPGQEMKALDKISFRIEAGERIGLIGRLGCGKSTILNMVAGLLPTSAGEIAIDGERVILTKAAKAPSDDPFATFSEWSSDADRRGYAGL